MKYKDFMNHLGERVDGMDAMDELICAFCIVITAILLSAIFTGAI